MLVKVLFAAVSLPAILAINGLVYRVPAGENAQNAGPAGFTVLALVFGIIMIVMFVVMYKRIDGMDPTQKITEERAAARRRGEKVRPLEAGEKVNLFEMIKYWITNLPALIGLFAEIIRFIAQMTMSEHGHVRVHVRLRRRGHGRRDAHRQPTSQAWWRRSCPSP